MKLRWADISLDTVDYNEAIQINGVNLPSSAGHILDLPRSDWSIKEKRSGQRDYKVEDDGLSAPGSGQMS